MCQLAVKSSFCRVQKIDRIKGNGMIKYEQVKRIRVINPPTALKYELPHYLGTLGYAPMKPSIAYPCNPMGLITDR